MSSFVYSFIIVILQISKLSLLVVNFDLARIGEYALASILGFFLIIALYFWMLISIKNNTKSKYSSSEWKLIGIVIHLFSKLMIFIIFALLASFIVIKIWGQGDSSSDNIRLILIGHIVASPLVLLAIAILDQFLSAKEAKLAVRLLAYSSFLNFSTSALLIQWLNIGAYLVGFIVGNLYFIIASHRRNIFTFKDYIYSYTLKRARNLFFESWAIAVYLYFFIIVASSMMAIPIFLSDRTILAIIFIANNLCFTLCILILAACSTYISDFATINSMWTKNEQHIYEKIIWLFWHVGAAVMAIIIFSGPLVSYLLPNEFRQLFVHLVWIFSIAYWLCLFVTPSYLLASLHQWREELSKHIKVTLFSLLLFAMVGVIAQNVWISLLGTIFGLMVSAIIFSRRVHILAREEYRSWFPEVQGEGVFLILLFVIAGSIITPFSTEDVFVACVFASNSLIVLCLFFLHRKRQEEARFL